MPLHPPRPTLLDQVVEMLVVVVEVVVEMVVVTSLPRLPFRSPYKCQRSLQLPLLRPPLRLLQRWRMPALCRRLLSLSPPVRQTPKAKRLRRSSRN